ncbi:MAG TPA: MFS transporter [Anaerolineales bacterium]|nr:MFS transporter [Anaerolineales bacterium]
MSFLRALRHRSFALMWTGQTVSRLGDSVYRIALSWWVLEETGSATAMSMVLVVSFLPMLLFLLVGGVVVDRLPRFRILFVSDIVNGFVVGGVALLAAAGRLEIWHVYVASAVFGLADAFFYPAYIASVPQIVPADVLPSANSLSGLSFQISGVVGPAIGATLVALGGTPAAFGLDGLSFFVSAACMAPLLRIAVPRTEGTSGGSPLRDLRDGLAEVTARTWLWLSIAFFGLANVVDSGPRNVAMPFLIHDHLGLDVSALGAVTSSAMAGQVLAAVVVGRYHRLRRRGLLLYGGEIVMGAMLILYGLLPTLPGLMAAAFVFGAAISTGSLVWTNTLQEMVPQERLGRVSSIDAVGSFVFLPLGFAFAGILTERVGPATVFLIGGSLVVILSIGMLLVPSIRRLD